METLHRSVSNIPVIHFPTLKRYSLRAMFVVVTISAIALYWFVARPTVLANRFVSAIEARDYETAKSLLVDKNVWVFEHGPKLFAVVDVIYAELLPRDWSDLLACRRRLIFRVVDTEFTSGGRVESYSDSEGVADLSGILLKVKSRNSVTHVAAEQPISIPDYTLLP
jgi:hypothetical protein